MIFSETPLPGAFVIDPEPASDDRGYFARVFCAREFEQRGLDPRIAQCSVSHNLRRGTLRGLHFQAAPYEEAKTLRCIRGSLYDVIVDLRPGSPTQNTWFGIELDAQSGRALHVPSGFAHGFITLESDTSVEYLISTSYVPEAARGIRYDDPTLDVKWPIPPIVISERDRSLPFLKQAQSRDA